MKVTTGYTSLNKATGKWECRFDFTAPDGQRKTVRRRGFKTKEGM